MRKIHRDIVSALIHSSDGKLLMGKKDPNKGGVYSDCWHIPGGGIKEGENTSNALVREIKEETGLDIDSIELIDDTGRGYSEKFLEDTQEKVMCNMKFNVFKIQLDNTAENIHLEPKGDLVELKWFSINDLKDVKLTPPSTELFRRLGLI
jgi:8-oxo-dGTP pyrophosphatase MutT (NUDIX family)